MYGVSKILLPNLGHPINQGKVLWGLSPNGNTGTPEDFLGFSPKTLFRNGGKYSGGPVRPGALGPCMFLPEGNPSALAIYGTNSLASRSQSGDFAVGFWTYFLQDLSVNSNQFVTGQASWGIAISQATTYNWFMNGTGGGSIQFNAPSLPAIDAWQRWLWVYHSGSQTASLYLNGRSVGTTKTPTGTFTSLVQGLGSFILGNVFNTAGGNFYIDDVCLWNRAPNSAEVWTDWVESSTGYPGAILRRQNTSYFIPGAVILNGVGVAAGLASAAATTTLTIKAVVSTSGHASATATPAVMQSTQSSAVGKASGSGTGIIVTVLESMATAVGKGGAAGESALTISPASTASGKTSATADSAKTIASTSVSVGHASTSAMGFAFTVVLGKGTARGSANTSGDGTKKIGAIGNTAGQAATAASGAIALSGVSAAQGQAGAFAFPSLFSLLHSSSESTAFATATAIIVIVKLSDGQVNGVGGASGKGIIILPGLAKANGLGGANGSASRAISSASIVGGVASSSVRGGVAFPHTGLASGVGGQWSTAHNLVDSQSMTAGSASANALANIIYPVHAVASGEGSAQGSATITHSPSSIVTGKTSTAATTSLAVKSTSAANGEADAAAIPGSLFLHLSSSGAAGHATATGFGLIVPLLMGRAEAGGKGLASASSALAETSTSTAAGHGAARATPSVTYAALTTVHGQAHASGKAVLQSAGTRAKAVGQANAAASGTLLLKSSAISSGKATTRTFGANLLAVIAKGLGQASASGSGGIGFVLSGKSTANGKAVVQPAYFTVICAGTAHAFGESNAYSSSTEQVLHGNGLATCEAFAVGEPAPLVRGTPVIGPCMVHVPGIVQPQVYSPGVVSGKTYIPGAAVRSGSA